MTHDGGAREVRALLRLLRRKRYSGVPTRPTVDSLMIENEPAAVLNFLKMDFAPFAESALRAQR